MIVAALIALALPGEIPAPLTPFSFLVGHCWRGTVVGDGIDTHCFTLADDGVHDRHQVVARGQTVYSGKTLYAWDAAAKAVRFVYTSPDGTMAGHVRPVADGLDFGTADFVANNGKRLSITARWKRVGDLAYDAIDNDVAAGASAARRYTRVD